MRVDVRVDMKGLDSLRFQMRRIANPNATPLMRTWMSIIRRDNEQGVLAGTDKDGKAMELIKYRPLDDSKPKLTDAQRNTSNRRQRKGHFIGRGPAAAGWNNNLSSGEYRKLDGPPLAPRGPFSRVITNLLTGFTTPTKSSGVPGESAGQWAAIGYWEGVVSVNGEPFLHYHFDGASGGGRSRNVTLPQRDLRGVRPEGRRLAREAMREWMVDQIRQAGKDAQSATAVAESAARYLQEGDRPSDIDLSIFNL